MKYIDWSIIGKGVDTTANIADELKRKVNVSLEFVTE
jgi:hypothetical protein